VSIYFLLFEKLFLRLAEVNNNKLMEIKDINIVIRDQIVFGNIIIQDGKIKEVHKTGNENKNCSKYALPGMIDPHVHLRDPGFPQKENIETGTLAAIYGGITTVFDMPNTNPPVVSQNALEEKKKLFENKAKCNWKLFVGASSGNFEFLENLKDEKVSGIKLFFGSTTGNMLIEGKEVMEKTFEVATKSNLIIAIHAEAENILRENKEKYFTEGCNVSMHSKIRSVEAAKEAVRQCIELSRKTGAKVHICHTSTKDELDLIEGAKKEGLKITCEIAPHHLFLTEEDYAKFGTLIQMNPPVRNIKHVKACWDHLKKGTINMIGTDHAPHTLEEKNVPYGKSPSGIPGLETALPLLLTKYHEGELSLNEIIKLYSKNVAELWGLNKGEIKEAKDADIIILDFNEYWIIKNENLKTKCGWTPWNGLRVKGKLDSVYLQGEKVI